MAKTPVILVKLFGAERTGRPRGQRNVDFVAINIRNISIRNS
jgi:hypothetical protein